MSHHAASDRRARSGLATPGARGAHKPDEKIEHAATRSSARAQNSSARPSGCAIDGSASARRRSCRCNRSSPPRAPRRAIPHRPTKPAGRAEEHPADAEDRGRQEGQDRKHPLARQPGRAPLREGAPGPLRPAEVKHRRGEPAGGQHDRDRERGKAEAGARRAPDRAARRARAATTERNRRPDAVVKKTIESAGCMRISPRSPRVSATAAGRPSAAGRSPARHAACAAGATSSAAGGSAPCAPVAAADIC